MSDADKPITPILASRNQSGPFAYAAELKNIPFPRMTVCRARGSIRGHEERSRAGYAWPARMGRYHGIPPGYAEAACSQVR